MGQSTQAAAFVLLLARYLPGTQFLHPTPNVPAPHTTHFALPVTEFFPTSHGLQEVELALLLAVLAGHWSQNDWPLKIWNSPGKQGKQYGVPALFW